MSRRRTRLAAVALGGLIALAAAPHTYGFPIDGDQTVLPAGTELGEDALDVPRELFRSEAGGGHKSYLSNLGDMAFNSPSLLGAVARRAGISCGTCHVNGASNARLYVPGLSSRPGNFDTTGALFNPKADDGMLDPFTVPSLRGARVLAPYGHDGRTASLRDFVANVIVNEFAGPEPSPAIVDALVVYIQDIDFLPNPRLDPAGRLNAAASDAERRGEALFAKDCAACHIPSAAFVDHRQHDVGSGGLFKTPTLRNADFNAPYFHDGRYDSFDAVVAHFDRVFALDLTAQERGDLVAYLTAIGDGERGVEPDSIDARLKEIADFASVLDMALPARDTTAIALAVETVGRELREMTEMFPDRKDSSASGGRTERARARVALKELVLDLRRLDVAAAAGDFAAAAGEYAKYQEQVGEAVPRLKAAQAWSLFERSVHDAHYAALRQVVETAGKAAR